MKEATQALEKETDLHRYNSFNLSRLCYPFAFDSFQARVVLFLFEVRT
jgi:hypothetical protein